MRVILCKDLPKLGKAGDVVNVKDGYARNYLIPNNLALYATEANIKRIEIAKQKRLKEIEARRQELKLLAEKLSGVSVNIEVEVNEEDKLYGSISPSQIASALKNEGFSIDENCIILKEPIRTLGIYEVEVKLAKDIGTKIKLWVVKK